MLFSLQNVFMSIGWKNAIELAVGLSEILCFPPDSHAIHLLILLPPLGSSLDFTFYMKSIWTFLFRMITSLFISQGSTRETETVGNTC